MGVLVVYASKYGTTRSVANGLGHLLVTAAVLEKCLMLMILI